MSRMGEKWKKSRALNVALAVLLQNFVNIAEGRDREQSAQWTLSVVKIELRLTP